ncbi:MAG: nucleotidyltransferase [Candidatus Omnitrophica bacterium 4484_171]|nr:MAG: nucleotidyltransferase [Candidatus Omnitrophica bacterium 4484_171]
MTKLEALKKQYKKALLRFEEILAEEKNDIVRDSAIKRFEFTFDLSWKLIKAFLEEEKGIKCVSPKECFRQAYRQGIIGYDDFWLKMADWRNETVHTYGEKFADTFYEKLPAAIERFKLLKKKLLDNAGR